MPSYLSHRGIIRVNESKECRESSNERRLVVEEMTEVNALLLSLVRSGITTIACQGETAAPRLVRPAVELF